ncbi:hypothetical protein L2E82_47320 [Cichorium intybus]|uniref:Uncharacterized protein n=1 Tax=Cichorium intybus TaxID=13427 RepID=A0ACB8YZB4_CICIN|nr:hypothetical protein L2E82_47320 [Cichorium intybus]
MSSAPVVSSANGNVDEYITQLMQCKPLSEQEVILHQSLIPFSLILIYGYWIRSTAISVLRFSGVDDPALWAGNVGNSWRTTNDINDTWVGVYGGAPVNQQMSTVWKHAKVPLTLSLSVLLVDLKSTLSYTSNLLGMGRVSERDPCQTGWKRDNNIFRSGYRTVLEKKLKSKLPGCNLEATPQTESRLKTFKKHCDAITNMKDAFGIEWKSADCKNSYKLRGIYELH